MESVNVYHIQLVDFELNPVTAVHMAINNSGRLPFARLTHNLNSAQTEQERATAIDAMEAALWDASIDEQTQSNCVQEYEAFMDECKAWPACASCGMSSLPSTVDGYDRICLERLVCLLLSPAAVAD